MIIVTVYETKGEIMLERYITIINVIDILNALGKRKKSGNMIARQIRGISRSTVYRTLNEMEKVGLLVCYREDGGFSWVTTDKAMEFWMAYRELPF